MKTFNKLKYLIIGGLIAVGGTIYAANLQPSFTPSLIPVTSAKYFLGTTSPSVVSWKGVVSDNLYLTGVSDGCATFSSNLLTSSGVPCGSGGGGSGGGTWATTTSTHSGRLINYSLNTTDIITIGGTATTTANTEYWFDPNTQNAHIGSSNTASTSVMGLFLLPTVGQGFLYGGTGGNVNAIASSSIKLSWFNNDAGFLTSYTSPYEIATSSSIAVPQLSYFTNVSGRTTLGGVATSTLSFSSPLSGTSVSVVGTAGGAITCPTCAVTGTTITVNGTTNQITSSAGAQDLSANRTWTLSIPSQFNIQQSSSTVASILGKLFIGSSATTTIDTAGNIVIPSGSTLTNTGKSDGCASWSSAVLTSTGVACGSGSGGTGNVATSTNETVGRLAYWTTTSGTPAKLADVATSSLAVGASISSSGTLGYQVGGTASTLSLNMANANTWTALQTFGNSTTTYGSFTTASTTDAYFGTGQGIAYIGSLGRLRATATSTFSLSGFTNDLATLTAGDSSLTFSGSYNGATARTVTLNTGNTNTWSVLQNFNYSSSTVYSSFLTSSTTNARIGLLTLSTSTAGTLKVDGNGVVYSGSAGSATAGGSDKQVQFNDGGTSLGGAVAWVWDKTKEIMGIGTTTPQWKVSIASSTAPQLALLTGGNDNGWIFRNAGGNFYLSSSSATTNATTSTTAFSILGSGVPSLTIGTSSSMTTLKNGSLTLGGGGDNLGNTGSTTITMAKLQFDGMSNTGSRVCAYIVGTAWVVSSGACTP